MQLIKVLINMLSYTYIPQYLFDFSHVANLSFWKRKPHTNENLNIFFGLEPFAIRWANVRWILIPQNMFFRMAGSKQNGCRIL